MDTPTFSFTQWQQKISQSSRKDPQTLKGGNECDRGWKSKQKISETRSTSSTNLIQKKIEIRIIPGTE